jgi:hypothetical protein
MSGIAVADRRQQYCEFLTTFVTLECVKRDTLYLFAEWTERLSADFAD